MFDGGFRDSFTEVSLEIDDYAGNTWRLRKAEGPLEVYRNETKLSPESGYNGLCAALLDQDFQESGERPTINFSQMEILCQSDKLLAHPKQQQAPKTSLLQQQIQNRRTETLGQIYQDFEEGIFYVKWQQVSRQEYLLAPYLS